MVITFNRFRDDLFGILGATYPFDDGVFAVFKFFVMLKEMGDFFDNVRRKFVKGMIGVVQGVILGDRDDFLVHFARIDHV